VRHVATRGVLESDGSRHVRTSQRASVTGNECYIKRPTVVERPDGVGRALYHRGGLSPGGLAVYAPPPWLIALGTILTGLAVAGVLYAWTGSRDRRRIVLATVASMIAFLIWRGALIIANGANLDIDYPLLLGLSFEDIGSGVMAFLFTALALGLGPDAAEPARRVVTSAGLAGAAAIIVDRFV
jgi:hypothetical protein